MQLKIANPKSPVDPALVMDLNRPVKRGTINRLKKAPPAPVDNGLSSRNTKQ